MSAGSIAHLDDRAVVRVGGADAGAFLQGLITNDMPLLELQPALFAGLLSPQGKLLFEFFVVKYGEGFLLDVAAGAAADLAKRLAMYKLRAKVEISEPVDCRVLVTRSGLSDDVLDLALHSAHRFTDPRSSVLGRRWLPTAKVGIADEEFDYDAHRISLGVPDGGKDYLPGELFPHEAMFDQLNGVSFTKGCYVGQEIVARMQHRGTARSRFLMVAAAGPLPPRGAEVLAGDKPIGQMGSSVGPNGLALVRLDRLAEAYRDGKTITIGGVAVTLTKPPYATFEVPTP